jgi:DNA polymerase III subunit epsilon
MDFVAIDVETANPDMASICQIGIARYRGGSLADEWVTFVDPQDYFAGVNVSIHGINEGAVKGSPIFSEVSPKLGGFLQSAIVVCHTHFDRLSLLRAGDRFRINLPECTWLDSARVARRAWKECAWKGYGLASVCKRLGYEFKHHDALEDAKAAAFIMAAAVQETGISLDGWLTRVKQPIDPESGSTGADIRWDGNPEGSFYGDVLVFTGALEIPRREAADMAAAAGFTVASGVTKKTRILVVGDQDVTKLAGHSKSTKHRKAEELIAAGAQIRIVRESDFKELLQISGSVA